MVSPFLKWAGGKRWLTAHDVVPRPDSMQRYVEPFLGGGALYFHLLPEKALLSDLNAELIHVYRMMKSSPKELYHELSLHQELHSKDHYYWVRSNQPDDEIGKAARFLYLNRACWNGLYRVNLRGEFNVPIGTKSSIIFKSDDFSEISQCLVGAEIKCADFEAIIDSCISGDFVFADPPYTVQHNLNNFLKYNEKIFSWDDQIRLHDALVRARNRGVMIVATNADHESVRNLYKGFGTYCQLERHSKLSGDASKRCKTTEALFFANLSTSNSNAIAM